MPANIKLGVSIVALLVAVAFAYYEAATGRGDLSWFVIGTGVFMVVAMWIFPEAEPKQKKGGSANG